MSTSEGPAGAAGGAPAAELDVGAAGEGESVEDEACVSEAREGESGDEAGEASETGGDSGGEAAEAGGESVEEEARALGALGGDGARKVVIAGRAASPRGGGAPRARRREGTLAVGVVVLASDDPYLKGNHISSK